MAMDNPLVSALPPTLLLELDQAFRSMHELDPLLYSILKQTCQVVGGEGCSIWLLNQAGTELKCTHVVGPRAGEMSQAVMRARKFSATYRLVVNKKINPAELSHSRWMDARIYHQYFNVQVGDILLAPLMARDELMGMIVVNKVGGPAFKRKDRDFIVGLARRMAVAIQNTQIYERQNHTAKRRRQLHQINSYLHQTLDIDELIPRIFREVNKTIHAEAQSIWLVDEEAGTLKCRFATGPESEILRSSTIALSAPGIVSTSVSRKKAIIIKDAQNDPRCALSADEKTGFVTRSLMTVPLMLKGKSIGAIQAVNKRGGEFFDQDDFDLFRSIADSAALAVNHAQLVGDLQSSYELMLDVLSTALDVRDHGTDGHSRRVVEYTARLAQQIGLDHEAINGIRRGALIHDIGKIGVPDALLNKPGALTSEERKIMDRHPQIGYYIVADILYLKEEIKIVICHHEKWDGTGYPFGLRGEQIPLGARLFSVADTFDAITSDRPYRESRSYEVARKIIEGESGRQFDPQVVNAFLAISVDDWTQIRTQVMEKIARRRDLEI